MLLQTSGKCGYSYIDCKFVMPRMGDYFISQILCGDGKINAVIDWTTACVHPVVWEIVRSYVYAAPSCKNGEINMGEFAGYMSEYRKFVALNEYDLQCMIPLFYYQIAVCDYYGQYYASTAVNCHISIRLYFLQNYSDG